MDERAYRAGLCWSKDEEASPVRTWTFREEKISLPRGRVNENLHRGYHCLLATWSDVQTAKRLETAAKLEAKDAIGG